MTNIDIDTLSKVTGGAGWGESLSNGWTNTKNFVGGTTAGLLHGPTGKIDQVEKFADTGARATKAGFETGAAINNATGNIGNGVSWLADRVNPSKYNQ